MVLVLVEAHCTLLCFVMWSDASQSINTKLMCAKNWTVGSLVYRRWRKAKN